MGIDTLMSAKVLIIGSGGREHALAWSLASSPQVEQVFIAPGNGGTNSIPAAQNVAFALNDHDGLLAFAQLEEMTLTVVGPEVPLAEGIVDLFQGAGVAVFGPTRAAAQIEASKAFAKAFMQRHAIPTADYHAFSDPATAKAYASQKEGAVVVKASGLAAGKGVLICDTVSDAYAAIDEIMEARAFGEAGDEIVIEERLHGVEFSVLAFSDGKTVVPMPVARDHKRALDGDKGLNTGGMGAYAPTVDVSPAEIDFVQEHVLQKAVDGLAAEAMPYVGVLYAGLMRTADGLKVLEFNCRFGDPETQVILPLLDSDLFTILQACITGNLADIDIRWKPQSCTTVVLAAPGYPQAYPKGLPISGLDQLDDDIIIFHAGTKQVGGQLLSNGGRVLAVTALGDDLALARKAVYKAIERIHFEGMHFRHDIGQSQSSYAAAGVDIKAGARAIEMMQAAVQATYSPQVLSKLGNFGGIFDVSAFKTMQQPLLVASTDGVGTKTKVAAAMGRWDSIGQDLVNHCINDILVQGARPLFFLDYVASDVLKPEQIAQVVGGMAQACQAAGCSLIGGETAEMPGVYMPGEMDVVGTIIGALDRADLIDGRAIVAGDSIVNLPSTGLHTNGFSLARYVLKDENWHLSRADLGQSIGETLLAVHSCYLPEVEALQTAGITIKGMAHITGGGVVGNLPRILPAGLGAIIYRGAWQVPAIFGLIQSKGLIEEAEMFRTFNMGLGMLLVLPPHQVETALGVLKNVSSVVGEIVAADGDVRLID